MVLELTQDNFEEEVLRSEIPVIVDFWASWCGPCKMLAPIFEETSKSYSGKLKFGKVSTEEYPDLADEYEVMGIPCLIIFHKGQEVDRIVGFQSAPALKLKIEEILKKKK